VPRHKLYTEYWIFVVTSLRGMLSFNTTYKLFLHLKSLCYGLQLSLSWGFRKLHFDEVLGLIRTYHGEIEAFDATLKNRFFQCLLSTTRPRRAIHLVISD
jgi:hypothetical protein